MLPQPTWDARDNSSQLARILTLAIPTVELGTHNPTHRKSDFPTYDALPKEGVDGPHPMDVKEPRSRFERVVDRVVGDFLIHTVAKRFASEQRYENFKKWAERNTSKACFAAGTPLLTPVGSCNIEDFQIGDLVLSRDEYDSTAPIEAKVVEEVFVRLAPILSIHVHGQVINTTGEHPFYVENKGWIDAQDLIPGDRFLSHDDRWISIEEIFDTSEWKTVYNLRIADHHTYFVGCDDWGFSAWVHNAACANVDEFIKRYGNRDFDRFLYKTQNGIKELARIETKLLRNHDLAFQQYLWEVYQMGSRGRLPRVLGNSPDVLTHTARHPHGRRYLEGLLDDTVHGWSIGANDAWMLGGIDSRKTFYLVTRPSTPALVRRLPGGIAIDRVYLRELNMLKNAGYRVPTNTSTGSAFKLFNNAWSALFISLKPS
ncbi:MAG: polymorphic toxin-type HINT domain-containing protein [Zavarzinella sp.]